MNNNFKSFVHLLDDEEKKNNDDRNRITSEQITTFNKAKQITDESFSLYFSKSYERYFTTYLDPD